MSPYLEFLSVQCKDVSYDVGFHPQWDRLRLTVSEDGYEQQASIEVWLNPYQARWLGLALIEAADAFRDLQ